MDLSAELEKFDSWSTMGGMKKPAFLKLLDRLIIKGLDLTDHGPNSLYRSLHLVGDDPVKGAIQKTLQEILSPEDYQRVCAVFRMHTHE
jgi:hypothetical protein